MKLSKPAMLSAFLCPGMGQWAAGYKISGAIVVLVTVLVAGSPFVRFIWGILMNPCEYGDGLGGCMARTLGGAWRASRWWFAGAVPGFALLWSGAVWHANGLTLPESSSQ